MATTYITEEMSAAVGRELARMTSYPITDSDIRRWAVAVYYPDEPPRLFWDAQYAATTVHGGIVAPEEFNPFAWLAEGGTHRSKARGGGDESPEKLLGIQGPGLTKGVNAGIEVTYGVRMRPGDVITSVRRLASYREREGRLGLMLITTTEDVWSNQNGELVKTTLGTGISY
jgi:N-terminal half of MaoC dehydratase